MRVASRLLRRLCALAATGAFALAGPPAYGASVLFTDNFNRPDGPVGNGWDQSPLNTGGELAIRNGRLTSSGQGDTGVLRSLNYSGSITASATITDHNGYGGLQDRFGTRFVFGGSGDPGSGYLVEFYRGDQNYANSAVSLFRDGELLGRTNSSFQFSEEITASVTLGEFGAITGHVSGSGQTFAFDFGDVGDGLSGLSNFGIFEEGPDSRVGPLTYGTIDNVIVTTGSAGASIKDLAHLSADVYRDTAQGYDLFVPLSDFERESGGLALQAYSHANDPTSIVLSIRGTEPVQGLSEAFKNYVADAALGTGINNAALHDYIDFSEAVLTELASTYQNASIQLTGHSLGGSIAQILGRASGLDTTVFDAPGTEEVWALEALGLSGLAGMGEHDIGVNYRMFGDQYSLVGTQAGEVFTLGEGPGPAHLLDFDTINAIHDPQLLANYLDDTNAIQLAGIIGPTYFDDLANFNIYGLDAVDYVVPLSILVSAFQHYLVDPSGYAIFTLEADPGSPDFASIMLPSLTGVDFFRVRARTGDIWSDYAELRPLSEWLLSPGTNGVEFIAIGLDGGVLNIPTFFLFDVSFASSGQFNGRLIQAPVSVPEPSTWLFLLIGFLAVGMAARRRVSIVSRCS